MKDIKIEDRRFVYACAQKAEDYLEDKVQVCETTNNINGIRLNNYIEDEEIEQHENFTVNNIKTELSFEKLNRNDNVKIEEEITTTNDIRINVDIKFLSCNHCDEIYQDYCTKCRMLVEMLKKHLSDIDTRARKDIPMDILQISELFGPFGISAIRVVSEDIKFDCFVNCITA